MARRLNALLLQVEMMPAARMATKEQLTKIFALEIEAMHDEIDALDRSAKRMGSLRDPAHREADRQVGWAYRLLHAYGITEELSFEEGGEVREALLEAGAEVDDIPFVAATYQSERQGALADREGRTRSPFLRDVLHRMAQVGLDDTVLNREAATEEIFRARAEALLASAVKPRRPKLTGEDEPERTAVEADPVPPPTRPAVLWSAEARDRLQEIMAPGFTINWSGESGYYGRELVTITATDGRDAGEVLEGSAILAHHGEVPPGIIEE